MYAVNDGKTLLESITKADSTVHHLLVTVFMVALCNRADHNIFIL